MWYFGHSPFRVDEGLNSLGNANLGPIIKSALASALILGSIDRHASGHASSMDNHHAATNERALAQGFDTMGLLILLIYFIVLPFLGYIAGRDNNRRAIPVALVIVSVLTVLIYRTMCMGDAVTVTQYFPKDRADDNYKTGIEFIIITWLIPAGVYFFLRVRQGIFKCNTNAWGREMLRGSSSHVLVASGFGHAYRQ